MTNLMCKIFNAGCVGSTTSATPEIIKPAAEGLKSRQQQLDEAIEGIAPAPAPQTDTAEIPAKVNN